MKRVLNIFITIGFILTALSALYVAMVPEHIKELVPQINWLTALIVGGTGGAFGSVGLYFKAFMKDESDKNDKEINTLRKDVIKLAELMVSMRDIITKLEEALGKATEENNRENINYQQTLQHIQRAIALIEVDLATKLTNPLIDKDAAKVIEGVLNEKENEDTI